MDRLGVGRCLVFGVLGIGAALIVLKPQAWPYLIVGLLASALAFVPLVKAASHLGPRNLVHMSFPLVGIIALLLAADVFLRMTGPVLYVYAVVGGVAATAAVAGERPWLRVPRAAAEQDRHPLMVSCGGLAAGAVLGASLVHLVALPWVLALVALFSLVAWGTLHGTVDPWRPDSPAMRAVPWSDGSGRHHQGVRRLLAAPMTGLYVLITWTVFVLLAVPSDDKWFVLGQATKDAYAFRIPQLSTDPFAAARAFLVAPFLNHEALQLGAITVLVLLFGITFESREGSARFVLIFLGAGATAVFVAGILLHAVHPFVDHPILDRAWTRAWVGGSAGGFGVLGAIAARARNPWPLMAFFVFWELNVGWWYLQSFTPAFHLTALWIGFTVVRYLLPPVSAPSAAPLQGPAEGG